MELTVQLLLTVALASGAIAEKKLWNEQTDILLEYFSIGYRAANSTDLPVMDIRNETVGITGVRLGDITTLKRLSDVIYEITESGDKRVTGVFGLTNFQLKIQEARMNNYTGPAIITSTNNSADIAYMIRSPDNGHKCKTKWEKFQLGEFADLKVITPGEDDSGEDYADEFNKRILPALNHHFKQPTFLAAISRTFDFCTYRKILFPF